MTQMTQMKRNSSLKPVKFIMANEKASDVLAYFDANKILYTGGRVHKNYHFAAICTDEQVTLMLLKWSYHEPA